MGDCVLGPLYRPNTLGSDTPRVKWARQLWGLAAIVLTGRSRAQAITERCLATMSNV